MLNQQNIENTPIKLKFIEFVLSLQNICFILQLTLVLLPMNTWSSENSLIQEQISDAGMGLMFEETNQETNAMGFKKHSICSIS